MKIYLAGCGKIGQRLGAALQADGHEPVGLKRQYTNMDFPIIPVDLSSKSATQTLPMDADIILFTVTPSHYDETRYAQVYDTILGNVIDWAAQHTVPPLVILVSSTSVYGQQNGEWVNENSTTEPTLFSGWWILFGEQQLRQRLQNTLTVRFSGIYGKQRTRLIQKALSGKPIQKKPPLWTNRIHETDCVGVLQFLINRYHAGRELETLYLVSDDTPVTQYDICAYICEALNNPPPPVKTKVTSTQLNKRCDNTRIKALGYCFHYPDYQSGYEQIVNTINKK